MDVFRPDQVTPAERFFLAGSYTKQDYIDSMYAHPLSRKFQKSLLKDDMHSYTMWLRRSCENGCYLNLAMSGV